VATAAVEWQLADDDAIAFVNRIDVHNDAAERDDATGVRCRLPTDLWEAQVPGDL
jgi:hypothetical protein